MPLHIQQLLLAHSGELDEMAEHADKLLELNTQAVPAVAPQRDRIGDLERQIEKLTKALAHVSQSKRSKPTLRRERRPQSNQDPTADPEGLCYYHKRFGAAILLFIMSTLHNIQT